MFTKLQLFVDRFLLDWLCVTQERQEAKQEFAALQKAMHEVETKDKGEKEKLQG